MAGVVVARTFALGGMVRPWLTVGALLALPTAVLAWFFAGPHRQRTAITAASMVVAVLLIPLASAGATPSPARLVQMADVVGLPGKVLRDVRIGNGRCRPACSELRRTAMATGSSFAKVRRQTTGLLRANGYLVEEYARAPGRPVRIDAAKGRIVVSLELRAVGYDTRLAQVWIAKGPAPAHEVG